MLIGTMHFVSMQVLIQYKETTMQFCFVNNGAHIIVFRGNKASYSETRLKPFHFKLYCHQIQVPTCDQVSDFQMQLHTTLAIALK